MLFCEKNPARPARAVSDFPQSRDSMPNVGHNVWPDLHRILRLVRPDGVAWKKLFHLLLAPVGQQDFRPCRVAQPITTSGCDREYLRTWPVMDDGLLLDGVDVAGDHLPVDEEVELTPHHPPEP